ncbi:MAG: adenylyl-sulfate kinase [FCB group bacterium]|nr:adenylyl-sulfate kinase [FCB group bacterium]
MTNLTQHLQSVSLQERENRNGHQSAVLWFAGLSASGKSTIAMATQRVLFEQGIQIVVLDGDNVRHGLNAGLGFSEDDRIENLRRVAEASKLFAETGFIVLTSFISPFRKNREAAREIVQPMNFYKIYIKVSIDTAEDRDPKGLYKKARAGEIKDFTGIDSPFEEPDHADLVIENDHQSVEDGVEQIIAFLKEKKIIS